uniref:Uncharacterized protein n=1 Tax=Brassica campestris TaxID=3711 RepID=M4ETZ6_BRACM
MTHEEFAEKHPHPPSPFYVKMDRPHEPAINRQRETDIDRLPSPSIDRQAPLTYRVRLTSIDTCHCGAEYETEYSKSIDTHTITSIDSNESPTTNECYPTSLNGMQSVDHYTLLYHYYPDFAYQKPNKNGRDDYSIGSSADIGFHEGFAVETVILSSNEDPTEEYDEDYWKERATEIAMQDERYSTHSFDNTPTPSIDRVY